MCGILGLLKYIAPQVEGKVELPRAAAVVGQFALLVGERQPQLDHLQHVHITPSHNNKKHDKTKQPQV